MSALNYYNDHIEALQRRIYLLEESEKNALPKDLFMKLKFKEFIVIEDNQLIFTENLKENSNLNYDIEEL